MYVAYVDHVLLLTRLSTIVLYRERCTALLLLSQLLCIQFFPPPCWLENSRFKISLLAAVPPCFRLASLALPVVRYHMQYDAKIACRCPDLTKGLPWRLSHFRLECWLVHSDIVCVHIVPRHAEELVLVFPPDRIFLELLGFGRWRRRVSDFGDEIRC
jgi:hypothetical protein